MTETQEKTKEPTTDERLAELEQRVAALEMNVQGLADHEHGRDARVVIPFLGPQ